LVAFGICVASLRYVGVPGRRFLIILVGVAALGVTGSLAACWLPYALPLQGRLPCSLVAAVSASAVWIPAGR